MFITADVLRNSARFDSLEIPFCEQFESNF